MPMLETKDGTKLYVKDWGQGRPVILIHGWPLTADSWEKQALALAEAGYRVISYDRRGFGRSEQPFSGYDYDTMADDLGDIIYKLGLRDASVFGFSMGGGEVARYIGRHGTNTLRQAGLISSVAPFMAKTDDNPDGVPNEVFEDMKKGVRDDRAAFMGDFLEDFYGEGTEAGGVSDAVLDWTWSMAMMGSIKATIDCIDAFGKTDFRPDMAKFDIPTLIVHGTGDKTVPIEPSGRQAAKMIKNSTLKEYDGAPHGLTATHADQLTKDMLEFLKD